MNKYYMELIEENNKIMEEEQKKQREFAKYASDEEFDQLFEPTEYIGFQCETILIGGNNNG